MLLSDSLTPALSAYLLFVTALAGLCMGSFLHCAAWRLVNGEKVSRGRSHCPDCGHVLGAPDLVPVFSWAILRGCCRYCKTKIPFRYTAAELICGVLYVIIILNSGLTVKTLEMLILVSILFVLSICDLYAFIIPDRFILAGIVNYAMFSTYEILFTGESPKILLDGLIGGLSVSLPVLLLSLAADWLLRRDTMGGGDIKLLFMTGLYFDWKLNLFALVCACFIGVIFALCWRALKSRRTGRHNCPAPPENEAQASEENDGAFPFGASISAAVVITILAGGQVMDWYMGLLAF